MPLCCGACMISAQGCSVYTCGVMSSAVRHALAGSGYLVGGCVHCLLAGEIPFCLHLCYCCLLCSLQALVNSTVTASMNFTKTSPKFGQWSDHRANTVYGLGFSSEKDLQQVRGSGYGFSYCTSGWQIPYNCLMTLFVCCSLWRSSQRPRQLPRRR